MSSWQPAGVQPFGADLFINTHREQASDLHTGVEWSMKKEQRDHINIKQWPSVSKVEAIPHVGFYDLEFISLSSKVQADCTRNK